MRTDPGPAFRRRNTEYRLYFALIFVLALPFALAGFLWDLVRFGVLGTRRGVLSRALSQAQTVTPQIFSA
jgi:hypothetical protein